jgi:hypothetical protein
LFLLFACPGCAVGTYFANRGADLLDCFIAEVSVGPGLDLHLQVGPAGTGLGVSKQWGAGLHGRDLVLVGRETFGAVIVAASSLDWLAVCSLWPAADRPDVTRPRRSATGRPRDYLWFVGVPIAFTLCAGASGDEAVPEYPENLNIEAGGSLLFVGAHGGINLIECHDFLAGVLCLDPVGDDRASPAAARRLQRSLDRAEEAYDRLDYEACGRRLDELLVWKGDDIRFAPGISSEQGAQYGRLASALNEALARQRQKALDRAQEAYERGDYAECRAVLAELHEYHSAWGVPGRRAPDGHGVRLARGRLSIEQGIQYERLYFGAYNEAVTDARESAELSAAGPEPQQNGTPAE